MPAGRPDFTQQLADQAGEAGRQEENDQHEQDAHHEGPCVEKDLRFRQSALHASDQHRAEEGSGQAAAAGIPGVVVAQPLRRRAATDGLA